MLFTDTSHWPHVAQNCRSVVCTSGRLANCSHWAGEAGISALRRALLEGQAAAGFGAPETGAVAGATSTRGASAVRGTSGSNRGVACLCKCRSRGLLRGECSLPTLGTMSMLYVSLKVEPGDVILTTMLTYRHAIDTVLANFRGISSGVRWCNC